MSGERDGLRRPGRARGVSLAPAKPISARVHSVLRIWLERSGVAPPLGSRDDEALDWPEFLALIGELAAASGTRNLRELGRDIAGSGEAAD